MPVSRNHKLVVLGGERVGKTAIIEQFIFGNHVIGQGGLPTLGDVYEATVETEKGPSEKLHIFDTPGSLFSEKGNDFEQEHFLSIADGYLLVYEITSKASYDLVLSLRQKIALKNKDAPIVVLGNKCDLNAIREVESNKASVQCKNHGVKFYEVSVLDRDGLKEAMSYMAWRMANPGRPFPQLSSLSSASGVGRHLTTSQASEVARQAPPHSRHLLHTEGDSLVASDEEDSEVGDETLRATSKPIPDDAHFPKTTAGGLFFTDCLSNRSKYRDDMI